jgi:hypothetical protein
MRRIVKARVKRLTLLSRGANLMPTLYKALSGDQGEFQLVSLTKGNELGELTNVVYVPNRLDGHQDYMTKEAVKDMAHAAARDGVEIDLFHDGKALSKDQAFVAEHFLINKGDTRFQDWKDVEGNPVDLEGAYATVVKILDPALRERVKSGELAQVSFEGPATVVVEKAQDATPPGWLKTLLKAIGIGQTNDPQETDEMNKTEIEALVATAVAKALEAVKPAEGAPAPEAKVDLTDLKAVKKHLEALEAAAGPDLTDPVAVKKHLEKLELETLKKGVDFGDPQQVADYLEKLEIAKGLDAEDEDEDEDVDDVDAIEDPQILKARLKKARSRSNRDPAGNESVDMFKGLAPKTAKQLAAGDRMAAFINGDPKN